jgi:hypothetical protein
MDHFLLNILSGQSIVPPAKFSASVESLDGQNYVNSIIIYLTKCPHSVKTDLEPGMMKLKAKPLTLLRHSFYKIKE